MNLGKLINTTDQQLENLVSKGNRNLHEIALRKYFLAESVVALFLVFTLMVISFALSVNILVQYCLSLIILGTIVTFISKLFLKKIEQVIVTQQITTLFIVSFFVAQMGGLLTSGGIIFLGVAPVLKTMVFRNKAWMISIFSVFLACLFFLFLFDDFFPVRNKLSLPHNRFFFTLNLSVITCYVFLFAWYSQKLFTGLEQREAQRQKDINEAKTRLYTNITHEFRTPLTVILGLAESFKHNSSDENQQKADTILRNGKSLLQLVDQLLDLGKLESGNVKVNFIHGNIIPFLHYVFQLQEYYAQGKKLEFTFEAESKSYELDFDPEKTTTIVSNLLNNAIKFTPDGGKICLKVGKSGNYLVIEIVDNGIGIPVEKQAKIFERFYQVDNQDTRREGGIGIGLALTKELVMLLHGKITVTSNPGNETVFTVKLPLSEKFKKDYITSAIGIRWNEQSTLDPNYPEEIRSRQKLLIIEDNLDVISYLTSCYQNQFSIEIAKNGIEGLKTAIELIPDIIISDIMMPEMDGFQLCSKLKEDYRTSHIPIILLTSKADLASRIRGLEQGADAYVVKPFNQRELLVRITNLLELRRKLHQRYNNAESFDSAPNSIIQRQDQFMKKIREIVLTHLADENFDIHMLCEEMAMSKSQLYRKFKALTNMSAAKYIRKMRMQRARQLLLTTSMNITEVSYEVGMKTLSTFSELFKDEFGQSPSEYQHHFNGKHRNN